MKTKKENYVSPSCKTIEMESEQIICGNKDVNEITSTHEEFEEDNYEW